MFGSETCTTCHVKSFDRLDLLLDTPSYWLAHLRVAVAESNCRRFFTVNEGAAAHQERSDALASTDALVAKLIELERDFCREQLIAAYRFVTF